MFDFLCYKSLPFLEKVLGLLKNNACKHLFFRDFFVLCSYDAIFARLFRRLQKVTEML